MDSAEWWQARRRSPASCQPMHRSLRLLSRLGRHTRNGRRPCAVKSATICKLPVPRPLRPLVISHHRLILPRCSTCLRRFFSNNSSELLLSLPFLPAPPYHFPLVVSLLFTSTPA